MPDSSIRDRLLPWLERWSVTDARSSEPLFPSLTLGHYEEEAYLVRHGERSDTLYLLESGLVRLFYTPPTAKSATRDFTAPDRLPVRSARR